MDNLAIPATDITPTIDFNADTHVLKLSGESYPENAMRFFEPVVAWLKEFLNAGNDRSITVSFHLTMFNSSTAKILMDIIYELNEGAPSEELVTVIWIYDEVNDLIEEFGMDLQEDFPALTVVLKPISQ